MGLKVLVPKRLLEQDRFDAGDLPEEGDLLPRIDPTTLLYPMDRFVQRALPIQILDHLLVSDGIECIAVSVWQQSANFVHQSPLKHLVHSLIDPLVEDLPGTEDPPHLHLVRKGS